MFLFQVKGRIQIAQQKQKKQYEIRKNQGVKVFHFAIGDQVLRRNMVKLSRKGSRLETDWLGPYTVTGLHKRGTVYLAKDGKDLKSRDNQQQLKPYLKRHSRFENYNFFNQYKYYYLFIQ
jgi:hypothetical protein